MDELTDEEKMQAIIEETKRLYCIPWEEVEKEIKKRQTLGKLPRAANVEPASRRKISTIKPEDLKPPKPHI